MEMFSSPGKQLFETDRNLDTSDIQFLEDGKQRCPIPQRFQFCSWWSRSGLATTISVWLKDPAVDRLPLRELSHRCWDLTAPPDVRVVVRSVVLSRELLTDHVTRCASQSLCSHRLR